MLLYYHNHSNIFYRDKDLHLVHWKLSHTQRILLKIVFRKRAQCVCVCVGKCVSACMHAYMKRKERERERTQ